MIDYSKKIGWDTPDGARALHMATSWERGALQNYTRSLKSFTDWILHGRHSPGRERLESLVDAAIESTAARKGCIQVVDPGEEALLIQAQRGFGEPFLSYFGRVQAGAGACGEAWRTGRRVIVEDVAQSPLFDPPSRVILLEAGARAVQSTPLLDASGTVIGVFSTHNPDPMRPAAGDLGRIDALAAEAAAVLLISSGA